MAQSLARASSILKKSNIGSDGPTPSNIEDEEISKKDKTIQGEDMEMTAAFCENMRAETELGEEVLRDEVARALVEQPKDEQQGRSGIVTTNEDEDIGQGDLHTQGQTSQRGRSPEKTRNCNKTSIQDIDMEMTRAGVKNQVDSTRLTQDNMDLSKMVPFIRQGPTSVEKDDMEMTKAGGRNNGNRTTMIQDNMEMTKVGGGYIENRTSTARDAMEMTRTNSDRPGQGRSLPQEHDMASSRSKVDRTVMTQENMEMTRIPPKLIVTNHQDDMEMTRAQMEGVIDVSPCVPSSQDDVAVQGEESGWETMHSPVISVSPILPELPVKTKTQGDLLRENFPSPAASPSPEMTRMLGGMPVKPKTKAGIWDGDVTSFMPVGESTRALKFRVPPPSTFSPNCSPLAKTSHATGEVGDLTSFAPGEEYESTRKLPTRPAPVKPLRQELPSPLASTALKEVGDLTTFSPMEEYESTRKLPKAPTISRFASVSTVDEEVTSPNRGARVQETMLPGLEVTAAPGCYCFASQRGAAEEEEEKRVECPLHVTIAPRNEDKQMGSSLARVSVSKSPPTKRLSEDFEEEQAKRQCRLKPQGERDEGEGAIIRNKSLVEQDREGTEKDAEGKESPEKRLKLSTLGERLAALADQSVAQPTNQSLYQPILGNQGEAEPHSVNQSAAPPPPTSQGLDRLLSKEEACDNIETGNTEAQNAGERNDAEGKQDALMVKEDSPNCQVGTSPARSSSPTRTSSTSRTEKTSTAGNVATLPAEDTDVSIFTELATRQRQKQEEKDGCRDSGQHHGEWKLMGFNDKVFASFYKQAPHLHIVVLLSFHICIFRWRQYPGWRVP